MRYLLKSSFFTVSNGVRFLTFLQWTSHPHSIRYYNYKNRTFMYIKMYIFSTYNALLYSIRNYNYDNSTIIYMKIIFFLCIQCKINLLDTRVDACAIKVKTSVIQIGMTHIKVNLRDRFSSAVPLSQNSVGCF